MVELAEGTGLENRRGCKSSAGSNPALSANFPYNVQILCITFILRFVQYLTWVTPNLANNENLR